MEVRLTTHETITFINTTAQLMKMGVYGDKVEKIDFCLWSICQFFKL